MSQNYLGLDSFSAEELLNFLLDFQLNNNFFGFIYAQRLFINCLEKNDQKYTTGPLNPRSSHIKDLKSRT